MYLSAGNKSSCDFMPSYNFPVRACKTFIRKRVIKIYSQISYIILPILPIEHFLYLYSILVLYGFFLSFTLYRACSGIMTRSLVLRHSTFHFPPNSGDIALCLESEEMKKINILFQSMFT